MTQQQPGAGYILEHPPEGPTMVVTGPWSRGAAEVLVRGEADGLVLNYARGFQEDSLEFLDNWRIRRLNVLDRSISDLEPIGRLGESLEALSVQVAPSAELDLGALPQLRSVAGEWALVRGTLSRLEALQSMTTWRFDEADLHAFRDHVGLERLTVKEAPQLESLSGAADLTELAVLGVFLAPELHDLSDLGGLASSLRELELEGCRSLNALDGVEPLVELRFLGFSDCGDIESLAPLASLAQLEVLHAWGTTRIGDADISPLARLPRLSEIRMRDRPGYNPRVADLVGGTV